nr:iron ABC transporter permease [Collinsella urealyticum]
MLVLCACSLVVDIMTGPAMLSWNEVLACLFQLGEVPVNTQVVVLGMRLPIALMALVVGCALGSSGAVMQTILVNPLASPYTLGVGAGAAFGASIAIVVGLGSVGTSSLAFLFSMLICLLIYWMGRQRGMAANSMVLSGIALLFLFQALQALVQYGSSETQNQAIVFWSFGSLQKTTWLKLAITATCTLICVPLLLKDSWKYTALLLGDEKAESLGVKVGRVKLRAFLLISLISATAVCFTGTIGFVGLAGPHIARMVVGEDQRSYIVSSAICGMTILSVASIISKVIIPGIIYPIGIITSIIGVPFFFVLVMRQKGGAR